MTEKQNRNKVLLLIIAVLLIGNAAMLAVFLMNKGGDDKPGRPDRKAYIAKFLEKEIGFSKAQLQQYDTLSEGHRARMKARFENIRNRKDEQFKEVARGGFSDSVINAVASASASSQQQVEVLMFTHMRSIRNICTEEQKPRFDSLFYKVFNRRPGEGKKDQKK